MRDPHARDQRDPEAPAPATVRVDGAAHALGGVPAHRSLLNLLRELGYTGTKEGCAEGDCGACTVAMREAHGDVPGPWTAVNSCLLPALACDGREIRTVEGLAEPDGALHAVQQALVETGGSQCGYCTPGFVVSLWVAAETGALTARGPDGSFESPADGPSAAPLARARMREDADGATPTDADLDARIDAAIEGNLCRCTGYLPIRRAARAVAAQGLGDARATSGVATPTASESAAVETASLESSVAMNAGAPDAARVALPRGSDIRVLDARFVRPTDLATALAWLAHDGAVAVAGGTDLGVEVAKHGRRPRLWVSLESVPELRGVRAGGREVRVGAAEPLSVVGRALAGVSPALDAMLRWFAARQIRNRATLGGNLGTASPIGDLAPVLLALDADLDLVGPAEGDDEPIGHGDAAHGRERGTEPDGAGRGTPPAPVALVRRTLPIAEAFLGYRTTAWTSSELIEAARWRRGPVAGATRRLEHGAKVGKRGTDDISIVAAAYVIDLSDDDEIVHARLAYGGVAATPVRAREVETWLVGRRWTPGTAEAAATRLEAAFEPIDDLRGSATYRRRLAGNLFRRFAAGAGAPSLSSPPSHPPTPRDDPPDASTGPRP